MQANRLLREANDLTGWNFAGQNLTNAALFGSTLTNANVLVEPVDALFARERFGSAVASRKADRSPVTDASACLNCALVGRPLLPPVSMTALTEASSPSASTGPTIA